MFGKSAPGLAEHARGVRFINHQETIIFFRNTHEFRQIREVAIHTENSIGHDEFARGRRCGLARSRFIRFLNHPLQIRHIVMLIDKALGARKANSIDNAGVVQFIAKNKVVLAAQSRNRADVRHVARIERNGGFFALEFGDKFFQFLVRSFVARRKPSAAATCTPLQNKLSHRLLELIDICQIQVRIGSQQNLFPRSAIGHANFHTQRFRRFHQTQGAVSIIRPRRL